MAKLQFNGKEYDLPDSEGWTTGELSEAEHALGASFGANSRGDAMAISFYIAVRRVDKDISPVSLADAIKRVPMGALSVAEEVEEEDGGPLEINSDRDSQANGGLQPSALSESQSLSKT